jgi:phosphonopyruvate decarboxylase
MIDPRALFESLRRRDVGLFTGVPDSLLASFCAYVDDHALATEHVIAANEGNAVALAAGYHLSSGRLGAVYLQNSGLGNTINPLTSLVDPEVYRVPLLLIIGWRGEPGVKDEPQHVKQGRITPGQLDLLEIPYWILEASSDLEGVVAEAFAGLAARNAPVALLVRKDAFSSYKSKRPRRYDWQLRREDALRTLLELASSRDLVVSTTGKTSREVYELRAQAGQPQRDFLTVGGMGHTASIALGVALGNTDKRVICLDGDGSVLMHLGALPIIGDLAPRNLLHVVLNNSAHESVGGQPTVAGAVDLAALARACGYRAYRLASDDAGIRSAWQELSAEAGPVLLEVRIGLGSRDDLGRPKSSPEENKHAFIEAARG